MSGTWVRKVVDCLDGFDLDHDGCLAVQVFVDGVVGIARVVREAGYKTEGRGGAGAAVLDTEFGGGNGVLSFGDGVHLWDNDRSTSVEGEADSGVIVSWNTGFVVREG